MKVTQQAIDFCNKYKICKGCPFVGGECVAPVSGHKFDDWIEKMNKLIQIEREK